MKRILILSFTDLSSSPRPYKQIKLLKDNFRITTVGRKASGFEDEFYYYEKESVLHEFIKLFLLVLKKHKEYYWSKSKIDILNKLKNKVFDLIIAHDERTLPLAQEISNGAKIILDAHEYHPDEHSGSLIGKFRKSYIQYLYKSLIKTPDFMLTVCDGISNKYFSDFNLRSTVIMNVPKYVDLKPTKIQSYKIKLIYHGLATSVRKLEYMIKMMDYLGDEYNLDLMLVFNRTDYFYMQKIKILVKNRNNVNIIPSVSFENIIPTLNDYDIGVFLLPPTNYSLKYALPNKFFEFIQARLAIAIGPSPEMANIVNRFDLGIVADDFSPQNLAQKIKSLTWGDILYYKNNCDKVAKKYSAELENEKFLKIIFELLKE